VTLEKINRVLGVELSSADVAEVFTRLGFTYKEASGAFEITPPFERLDLEIAEDLIEEVGRISGYDTVAATGLPLDSARGKPLVNPQFFAAEAVREDLTKRGYSEVITSVFTDKGERAVANKIGGDKPYLRDSLIPGLEDALLKNKPNKELLGLAEVKLFEIGTVWKDGEEKILVGTISEKEQASEEELKPIEADHYDDLPLSAAERYQPFSKYPFISRDIAMWVPSETAEDDVQSVLAKTAGELCVRLERFDRFEKENRVSYAFRLIFQSFEKTLTDAEVQARMDAIYATATAKGWEVR
jgi:phenylalanyl-tRNA synthetase beta subunit